MAVLLTCHEIGKAYGAHTLFEKLSLSIHEGDRLGVIGPNGSGKSTLMEILAGVKEPDSGAVSLRQGTRLGYVPQVSAFDPEKTAEEMVRESIAALPLEEGERAARVAITLGKAGFDDASVKTGSLSGGWEKRLAIAAELIKEPDLLLLDEPTNHLDLEGILWLEKLLAGARLACLVISHDRYFLENAARCMAEISHLYPDGILYVEGNYTRFLEKKEEFLEAQARYREALANRVRRELEWLRRGPKARTTKSRARSDAAESLIQELAETRARTDTPAAAIDFTASQRKTKHLLVARNLEKQMGGRTLFRGLNLLLSPGRRIGLVGPNGSGKTTLLNVLMGEWGPDAGRIERADLLRVVYFEQRREQIAPEISLRRALCPEGDSVIYRGRPIHVAGWAKRFLFRAEQLEMPVGNLSGGERARVFIARLMLQPADVLLLDEPTNDLDIPTLETLEESLLDFPGALVLVTHDRYMLDRVSTVVLGLDGEGGAEWYADYSQWEQAQTERRRGARPADGRMVARTEPPAERPARRKKLSYLDQIEWDQMEERILEAEAELETHRRELEDPAVASNAARVHEVYGQLQAVQKRVDELYARWAELEAKLSPE